MTTGLIAPDGIVGTLPSYPGVASGPNAPTIVLYTEKILDYFISGTVNGYVSGGTFTAATGGSKNKLQLGTATGNTINYTPSVTTSEQPPASGSFTVYFGSTTAAGGGSSNPIQAVTCTGVAAATQAGAPAGSENLTGCSGGTGFVALGNWVGGPGAAIEPYSVLSQIGEGKNGASSGPEKLFGNNEDLTVLRAAYDHRRDPLHRSGADQRHDLHTGSDPGAYDDVSNPYQQTSPSSTSPTQPQRPAASTRPSCASSARAARSSPTPTGASGCSCPERGRATATATRSTRSSTPPRPTAQHWSVPKVVLSTDYTFAASAPGRRPQRR